MSAWMSATCFECSTYQLVGTGPAEPSVVHVRIPAPDSVQCPGAAASCHAGAAGSCQPAARATDPSAANATARLRANRCVTSMHLPSSDRHEEGVATL